MQFVFHNATNPINTLHHSGIDTNEGPPLTGTIEKRRGRVRGKSKNRHPRPGHNRENVRGGVTDRGEPHVTRPPGRSVCRNRLNRPIKIDGMSPTDLGGWATRSVPRWIDLPQSGACSASLQPPAVTNGETRAGGLGLGSGSGSSIERSSTLSDQPLRSNFSAALTPVVAGRRIDGTACAQGRDGPRRIAMRRTRANLRLARRLGLTGRVAFRGSSS